MLVHNQVSPYGETRGHSGACAKQIRVFHINNFIVNDIMNDTEMNENIIIKILTINAHSQLLTVWVVYKHSLRRLGFYLY